MANHKSALKRIRQTAKRREHNRYYAKTMRNAVRRFRELDNKKEAEEKLPEIVNAFSDEIEDIGLNPFKGF